MWNCFLISVCAFRRLIKPGVHFPECVDDYQRPPITFEPSRGEEVHHTEGMVRITPLEQFRLYFPTEPMDNQPCGLDEPKDQHQKGNGRQPPVAARPHPTGAGGLFRFPTLGVILSGLHDIQQYWSTDPINRAGRPPLAAAASNAAYVRPAHHLSDYTSKADREMCKTALVCA